VDNGSDDDTLATIHAGNGVRILHNPTPRAYAKSLNMGAAAPGPWDVLIVANNDVIFTPRSIELMVAALSDQVGLCLPMCPLHAQGAGITPPILRRPKTYADALRNIDAVATWWDARSAQVSQLRPVDHPYVPQGGYCFAAARDLWDRLGGMDEGYELFGEDYDFFDRAQRITKLVQHCGAYVEHLEHQTVAWLGSERDVRMARGRFLLAEKRENLRELVSVILPTYNRTDALFEAVDSVIRQTFPHWKLYVIDDGSRDWDVIQREAATRYRDHHARIWWFHRQHNGGPGAARNFGLDACAGKYVAFLDSDDIWYPGHLEAHYYAHERAPGLLMTYSPTDFAWRWHDGARYQYKRDTHPEAQLGNWEYTPERLAQECFIKTSTVFCWGEVFRSDALRFAVDPRHRDAGGAVEDWDLFRRIAQINPWGIRLVDTPTARTHWAKNPREEAHHSARLIPWADYTTVPGDWVVNEIVPPPAPLEGDVVTVVVPTCERPDELRRCLEALPGLPVVVVADGAPAARYAEPIAAARPRTGLLSYANVRGPSYARNRGAEAAAGDWLWFLDDDDLALPGWRAVLDPYLSDWDALSAGVVGRPVGGRRGRGA